MVTSVSSSAICTLPVYVSNAGRSNSRVTTECSRSPKWFDGAAAWPLRSQGRFIEGGMDLAGRKITRATGGVQALPPVFHASGTWLYLLGVRATLTAEMIALKLHPELAKNHCSYLFVSVLANFISLIYWLVCVYEYHVVLAQATGRGVSN